MRRHQTSVRKRVYLGLVAALTLAACGSDDATEPFTSIPSVTEPVTATATSDTEEMLAIEVRDAWIRPPARGQTVAAGYLTFINPHDVDVRVRDVSSPAGTAELHETVSDADGVMRMVHRPDGFVVAAGGELVFQPGGAHVMLTGLDPLEFALVDEVELIFDLGEYGSLSVVAEIRRNADAAGPDDGDDAHGNDPHDHAMHDDAMHDDAIHDDAMHDETDGSGFDQLFADLDLAGWAGLMHDLDDELHAGVLEVDRQRAQVAAFRVVVTTEELPASIDVEALLDALDRLDAALADEDISAAAAAAFEVHDLAHALMPHHH